MKKFLRSIICFILVGTILGSLTYFLSLNEKLYKLINKSSVNIGNIYVEKFKVKIIDETSKSRPYAVSINNNHAAWPHAGLQDAYLGYELIAEGGITRLIALFKDQNTTKIGSVRSARHYFLDYIMENDAIFVHYGQSPQAKEDLSSLNINNVNAIFNNFTKNFTDKFKINSNSPSYSRGRDTGLIFIIYLFYFYLKW